MSSLFSAPKAPEEDPAVKAQRDQEQKRAEDDRIRSIQGQLSTEDVFNGFFGTRFGTRSLLGPLGGARAARRSLLGSG